MIQLSGLDMITGRHHHQQLNGKKEIIFSILIVLLIHACDLLADSRQALTDINADWPHWRGSTNDNISVESDWNPMAVILGPKIVWEAEVGDGYASVAIKGPCLYTAGHKKGEDTVFCLEMVNGRPVWTYTFSSTPGQYAGPKAAPCLDEDSLYILAQDGQLFCFGAEKGEVRWKKHVIDEHHDSQ